MHRRLHGKPSDAFDACAARLATPHPCRKGRSAKVIWSTSLSHDTVYGRRTMADLMEPEPLLADGHAVLPAAIVWNTRVPSVGSTERCRPRCPRPLGLWQRLHGLPHLERHVDWIKRG